MLMAWEGHAPARTHWLTRAFALVFVALVAAGCAVRLAPDYDAAIVEGLQKANEEALVLFAGVAKGTAGKPFSQRAAIYTAIIGKLDALRMSVTARVTPAISPAAGAAPSLPASEPLIGRASNTLSLMAARDERQTLTPGDVANFREGFERAMLPALFYEKGLKR